ncbi:zinc finger protein ZIC 4 [Grus japonensis]|uniref:Zinc finger protein ZIC 4 n=1 Tax=Grus japonensis TaxID=30415 RepID=A0ABC9X8V8_GRUJA
MVSEINLVFRTHQNAGTKSGNEAQDYPCNEEKKTTLQKHPGKVNSTTTTTIFIIIIIIIIIWQAKPRWSLVKRERLARRSHQQPLTPSLTRPRLWQQVATPDTMVTTTTTQKLGIPLCSLDSMSSLPMQLQVAI